MTFLADESYTEMCWIGGFGCVGADTRIYCAERQVERTIEEWAQRGEAPVVFAYDEGEIVLAQAEVPFRKGHAELYEVTFSNGAVVTLKGDHHLLSRDGWIAVRDATDDGPPVRLPGFEPSLLRSSWESCPPVSREDALRSLGTGAGSPAGYQPDPHSRDAQPPADQGADQGPAPLRDGVPTHSHADPHEDGPAAALSRSRSSVVLDRLASRDASRPDAPPEEGEVALLSGGTSEATLHRPADGQSDPGSPEPNILRYVRDQRFVPDGLRSAISQAWTEYTITGVRSVGEQDYFDLSVPIYGNYITGGIVHHNTAKSDCLVTSIIKTGFDYPGCTMVLARDELVNLKRTTLVDLLGKGGNLIEHHNKTESVITWPAVPDHNGVPRQSKLFCFGLMTGDYVQKLKSLQPFRIFIDEADKILEEMFDMCVLRLRQKAYHRETGKLGKNQVKAVANDEGNNWLWRRFVGKPHPGFGMTPEWARKNVGLQEEPYQPQGLRDIFENDIVTYHGKRHLVQALNDDETVALSGLEAPVKIKDVTVIIQRLCLYAFSEENLSLNQQNLANSRGVSAAMRDKYILGKVDTQTGLLFPEFSPSVHIIPEEIVPFEWKVLVGIDHGFDHPTAAVAMALSPAGDIIIFDEYEQRNLSPVENANGILELLEGYEAVRFKADSQMWNVDPRSPGTIADDYQAAGLRPLERANKNRDLSIARIKDYLTPKAASLYQPDAKPRMYVMQNCEKVIRTLHYMQWDDFNAKRHDDILDALRYAVMAVYNTSEQSQQIAAAAKAKPFDTWSQRG